MSNCVFLPEGLFSTLPTDKLSEECMDGDFSCGHWVHRTRSPEGNAILSAEFSAFLGGKR